MNRRKEEKTIWKNPLTWICIFAIGYWVYSYHLEHAMGILPYAILLLCPLMHIFMHHGHGSDHRHSEDSNEDHQKKNGGQNAQ